MGDFLVRVLNGLLAFAILIVAIAFLISILLSIYLGFTENYWYWFYTGGALIIIAWFIGNDYLND